MSRNNDVFQVLIPTVATIAPAGSTLDDLGLGQLGAFDYETNLAVDASVRNFYFAVGTDDTGANTNKNNINKSSGTHIQTKNVIYLTNQCYVAPVDKEVTLSNWVAQCDTEYGVRFEIRNQEAYRLNGYNQVVKYYSVMSNDCVPCDTGCPDGDCMQVAADLMELINNDPDAVIKATAEVIANVVTFTGAATAGGSFGLILGPTTGDPNTDAAGESPAIPELSVVIGDTPAIIADKLVSYANSLPGYSASLDADEVGKVYIFGAGAVAGDPAVLSDGALGLVGTSTDIFELVVVDSLAGFGEASTSCPNLIFTVNPSTFESFCDINLNYFFPRQTDIIVVGTEGFVGNSTIETTKEMVYEDGSGYDIKQLEYEAGGWNGRPGPYRVGELIGVAFPGFLYFANQASNYDMIHIQHDQNSVSGWRDDNHFERTIIATDIALGISDTIGAFVNTMVADLASHGEVDPIDVCVNA